MRRIVLLTLMLAVCSGCGTVRYRVTAPTDSRRVQTEVQWDVVELKFNDMWMKMLPEYFHQ